MRQSKYEALERHLKSQEGSRREISLSFAEIESLIGQPLPRSAYTYREWWSNQTDVSNRPQAKAWIGAGFEVDGVQQRKDIGVVRFRRRHASYGRAVGSPMRWTPFLTRADRIPQFALERPPDRTLGPNSVSGLGSRSELVMSAEARSPSGFRQSATFRQCTYFEHRRSIQHVADGSLTCGGFHDHLQAGSGPRTTASRAEANCRLGETVSQTDAGCISRGFSPMQLPSNTVPPNGA
jgi:hypothetical protein